MRLFAIGDTHLPSTRNKDMHRFGWTDHPLPLQRAWDEKVRAEDVIIVAGDISWATRPTEVMEDLKWLDERPGRKLLVRGNHDYWWGDSASKLRRLLEPFKTLENFLQNTAVVMGPWLIAGSRLWTAPEAPPMPGGEMGDEPGDAAYVEREARRLATSIEDALKKEKESATPLTRVVAVHFPPLYANEKATAFSAPIEAFKPKVCVYGHLHSTGIPAGFTGERAGVRYVLASCDAAKFSPVLLDEQ
ncbi:MAG: metallophosphoesterase [Hyalangium sp.]|uniref:metallophosphoesterase n=1 Tax=Hyalangium sp. TaxID=2028555 RepID=UPI00389AEEFA